MKVMTIILFFCSALSLLQAQNGFTYTMNKEGRIVAIPRQIELNLNIPSFNYKSYTPQTGTAIEYQLKEIKDQTESLPSIMDSPMNMQILSAAYRPFFNPYALMLHRVNPSAFDFKEIEILPLSESLYFSVAGQKQHWIGLGGITSLQPALTWKWNKLTITGGSLVSSYATPFNLSPEYMGGLRTHISYELNDRFGIDTWGQYAVYNENEKKNPHVLMNPFYDHTNVGGAIRMKVTENFGIGAGMQYEFNPVNRKWNRQILLYPIFQHF